jgi:2-keto-4-pentenoate hydratase/2-oxohepta-3-ene-1,7-dioic acid hydratase in catechol pathway
MKLVRYRNGKRTSYGTLTKDKIVCLPTLAKALRQSFPKDLEALIALGAEGVTEAQELLKNAKKHEISPASGSVNEVAVLAPIPKPGKIVCLGLNYRDHAAEQGKDVPDEPVIFMKPCTAIIGPKDSIVKPSFVKQLDYEAELAIIIGKKAKNVSASEAESHIFGYTILNDVSARDVQFKDKQWTRGKGFDTFAPTGPCVTTADEMRDTSNLAIRTWVNDDLRQDSSTRNMAFNVSEIIRQLSQIMTLEPCDIIATGTPAGVGFAMKPQPKFLQAGDTVKIEIEGIGVLENRVTEPAEL